jgi:hypothetical protein
LWFLLSHTIAQFCTGKNWTPIGHRLPQTNRFRVHGGVPLTAETRGKSKRRREKINETETATLRIGTTAIHRRAWGRACHHGDSFWFSLGTVSVESDGFFAGFSETPEAGEFMTQHPDAIFGLEKEIIVLMSGTEAVKAAMPKLARPPWGDGGDRVQIRVRLHDLCIFTQEVKGRAATRLRDMTGWYMADLAIKSAVVDFANELLTTPTIPKARANKLVTASLKKHLR